MNRKLLAVLIGIGVALPGVAEARVTRSDLRQDHRVVHHEKRELRQARQQHEWREARHEKRELHHAQHKLHRDQRHYRQQH